MPLTAYLTHPLILIGAGGAIGSILRYLSVAAIDQRWGSDFPLGTMLVNICGSFAIGLLAALIDNKQVQAALIIGVLGGFTTFSAFSLQAFRLMEGDRWMMAATYIFGSVALCLLGTLGGQAVARIFHPLGTT